MLSFGNELYVRSEPNGITVYEKKTNLYKFYKNISMECLQSFSTAAQVRAYLEPMQQRISRDIVFGAPFHVNWLIEETCNMDCIYCFAHDKMNRHRAKEAIRRTAEHILSLGILNVGLSGGEPTMNPYLAEVLKILDGRCSINLDTNGTLPCLRDMSVLLKHANVLVRVTLDAVDDDTLRRLRPAKSAFIQLPAIRQNITAMLAHGVPLMVHTVVTQYNLNRLAGIAEELVRLGVQRWHLYGVNYSEKCKDIYDQIKVTQEELVKAYMAVKNAYGDKIEMSVYFDEGSYSANSVLLVDSDGRFYLDSIRNGIHYIGTDPTSPSAEEICAAMDIPLHCKGYLWTPDCL